MYVIQCSNGVYYGPLTRKEVQAWTAKVNEPTPYQKHRGRCNCQRYIVHRMAKPKPVVPAKERRVRREDIVKELNLVWQLVQTPDRSTITYGDRIARATRMKKDRERRSGYLE
jgi:hypothetical protein